MRYLALCTDYDGTIAHHGRVDARTIESLERLRESGRKLVLVTDGLTRHSTSRCPSVSLWCQV